MGVGGKRGGTRKPVDDSPRHKSATHTQSPTQPPSTPTHLCRPRAWLRSRCGPPATGTRETCAQATAGEQQGDNAGRQPFQSPQQLQQWVKLTTEGAGQCSAAQCKRMGAPGRRAQSHATGVGIASPPDEGRGVLELPAHNVGPLVEPEGQVAPRADPVGKVGVPERERRERGGRGRARER